MRVRLLPKLPKHANAEPQVLGRELSEGIAHKHHMLECDLDQRRFSCRYPSGGRHPRDVLDSGRTGYEAGSEGAGRQTLPSTSAFAEVVEVQVAQVDDNGGVEPGRDTATETMLRLLAQSLAPQHPQKSPARSPYLPYHQVRAAVVVVIGRSSVVRVMVVRRGMASEGVGSPMWTICEGVGVTLVVTLHAGVRFPRPEARRGDCLARCFGFVIVGQF